MTRVTIDRGPPRAELHAFGGSLPGHRHQSSITYLGAPLCKGIPCSAEVPSGTEVIVTGGSSFPPSEPFDVPSGSDVHLAVHPGAAWKKQLAMPSLAIGTLTGLTGAVLIGQGDSTRQHWGAGILAGGAALVALGIYFYASGNTTAESIRAPSLPIARGLTLTPSGLTF